MKTPFIISLLTLTSPLTFAETLKDADREAILEKLESIRKGAETSIESRFRTATSAFRTAIASESAALDLYLNCEEKVNFIDMKKKSSDFREWRKQKSDTLGDAAFKNALRQQLRWLLLTMEAASPKADRENLAIEAQTILESVMSQTDDLHPHRGFLDQAVTSSVFARAYNLGGLKVENWPLSPLAVSEIYEQILLPPLRKPDRIPALKAAWDKRINMESMLVNDWSHRPNGKGNNAERSPQFEKFIIETLPNLQWQAEIDLFNSGDQKAASLRMLQHIEKYLSHDNATKWSDELTNLLSSKTTTP
jgi:hypothetical protein